jgi:hypothetical protein
MSGHYARTTWASHPQPGLYFAGSPAAVSLGPSVRFIAGTHTSVRQLARSLAHRAKVAPAGRAANESRLTTAR